MGTYIKEQGINGRWSDKAKLRSINTLELLAMKFAIKAIFKEHKDGHIRIMNDNVTGIAYINNMGGCKSPCCNKIAYDVWEWGFNKKSVVISGSYPRCT